MTLIIKKHWPALAAAVILVAVVAWLYFDVEGITNGLLIYGLDDAYIHTAIAKHLALDGIWGLTPFEWSSSSSSLLWTLILAASYTFTGPQTATPFVLNILIAVLLLATCEVVLDRFGLAAWPRLAVLLVIILVCPVPLLIFSGMEHLLQILLDLILTYQAAKIIARSGVEPLDRSEYARLLLLAILVSAVRYEGLFLIFSSAALFATRRRYRLALYTIAAAVAPLFAFGVISKLNGSFWLPNSVLVKGSGALQSSSAFLLHFISNLRAAPYLAGLLVLAAVAIRIDDKTADIGNGRMKVFLKVFYITALLHLAFGGVGWLYRYEAYLIVLAIVALSATLQRRLAQSYNWEKRRAIAFIAILAVGAGTTATLGYRAYDSIILVERACSFTYFQQYQMARFLNRFYSGESVAANDVGAINYYADLHCLDLWGLGTVDVARARLDRTLDTDRIRQLAQQNRTGIAIVYEDWFSEFGGVPAEWQLVGRWKLDCVYCGGGNTISFFAVNPGAASELRTRLRLFSPELPQQVEQLGPYTY